MKNIIFLLSVLFTPLIANAQISTHRAIEIEPEVEIIAYDSTLNFPGAEPESIIGQQLYLLPSLSARGEIEGYSNFRLNPTTSIDRRRPQRTYYLYSEGAGGFLGGDGSNANLMSHRYYDVLDVIKEDGRTFLKLLDVERDAELYFIYPDNTTIEIMDLIKRRFFYDSWPFLVVGFYEKLRDKFDGNSFVLKNSLFTRHKVGIFERESLKDLNTGRDVEYYTGKIWHFEELTVDENYRHNLAVILRDDDGQKIVLSLNYADKLLFGSDMGLYTLSDFNHFYDLYGESLLMALEGRIQIGFTSELVQLALSPDYSVLRSNTDVVGNSVHEQWIIGGGRYIYLEDGIVTSLQF